MISTTKTKGVLLILLGTTPVLWGGGVLTGLDRVSEYTSLFQGRRVGIMANQTAYDRSGRFVVDVFLGLKEVKVTALFAPEHGLSGRQAAGEEVKTEIHPRYGIPVYSLYGPDENHRDPVLDHVDVLVFDMQDIGTRFYTYVSSMALAMKAVAQAGKTFVVLDRPNPLGGLRVEGPILDPNFASFKGLFPIPVVHGLTVGELARLIVGEQWLGKGLTVDLHVVPLSAWRRDMMFDETSLSFIKPSPNIPDALTALVYPGTALIEGTNLSEGRGTDEPFLQIGAPWIDGERWSQALNALSLDGVSFAPIQFTPRSSKHADVLCHGVRLQVTDQDRFRPFVCGVTILQSLYKLNSEKLVWLLPHLDELCGTDQIRQAIEGEKTLRPMIAAWEQDCRAFQAKAKSYLLYKSK